MKNFFWVSHEGHKVGTGKFWVWMFFYISILFIYHFPWFWLQLRCLESHSWLQNVECFCFWEPVRNSAGNPTHACKVGVFPLSHISKIWPIVFLPLPLYNDTSSILGDSWTVSLVLSLTQDWMYGWQQPKIKMPLCSFPPFNLLFYI